MYCFTYTMNRSDTVKDYVTNDNLLGSDAVKSGRSAPTFQRKYPDGGDKCVPATT